MSGNSIRLAMAVFEQLETLTSENYALRKILHSRVYQT